MNFWQLTLEKMLNNLNIGEINVTFPDGEIKNFKGKKLGPIADVTFLTEKSIKDSILGGSLGFCESFIDGDIKSNNIGKLIEIGGYEESGLNTSGKGYFFLKLLNKVFHLINNNTINGSKRNISAHYDLGNNFYKLWLDKSMTYSSAYFNSNKDSLFEAQQNKYKKISKIANLEKRSKVLEIGCGWGGFAEFAAKNYNSLVTAITISKEQFEFTKKRIEKNRLNKFIDVKLIDYRKIKGSFDRIISIEMIEAVGERYWPIYFSQIKKLLKPNGNAAIQVITIDDKYFDDYKKFPDFIQKYIFPGGMLPSISAIEKPIQQSGLKIDKIDSFGKDYASTLSIWNKQFNSAWPKISKLGFDNRFHRMWNLYFSYCEGGFKSGSIDVKQIKLSPVN
ncbi:MAG: SAM-dependent methyltransferase [SAR116 cluster bacterium]|nr:SAM-dependent methyltransferase [SAR116 cluster bacterium]